jgi:hypothetical protein
MGCCMAELTRFPPDPFVKSIADLTIEAFAHDEIHLREALRDREADFVRYRELALAAIEALAEEAARRRAFQRRYYALLNERQGGAR